MNLTKKIGLLLAHHTKISRFIPDRLYLKLIYKAFTNKTLSLGSPISFNEKIQWIKLNKRDPSFIQMVDKCEAKIIVSNIIGDKYIIPTLKVWDRWDDIDFSVLPQQFVLKTTHDSGSVVIVRRKDSMDYKSAKKQITDSLNSNFYYKFREWAYKNVKPRIIAEEYIEFRNKSSMRDYKFFCFNGEPKFLYVSEGLEDHSTATISFFDFNGNQLPFHRKDYKPFKNNKLELPNNFGEMIDISSKISKEINTPFVRIDLYNVDGIIYFSEITLYPNAGLIPFDPPEYDTILGNMIDLK